MTVSSFRRLHVLAAVSGMAMALAGCTSSGMTYGTGKTPGAQTLEDLAGIAALGSPKKETIAYGPRAPVVAPPPGTPLPPPGTDQGAVAANWPNDPDLEARKFKQEMQARADSGEAPVNFRLPPKQRTSDEPDPTFTDMNKKGDASRSTPQQNATAMKIYADSRGGGVEVGPDGKPIRKYLTEPPSDYRVPDPNAPVEIEAKPEKKKFKWPWQQ